MNALNVFGVQCFGVDTNDYYMSSFVKTCLHARDITTKDEYRITYKTSVSARILLHYQGWLK